MTEEQLEEVCEVERVRESVEEAEIEGERVRVFVFAADTEVEEDVDLLRVTEGEVEVLRVTEVRAEGVAV